MSQISQFSKLAHTVTAAGTVPPPCLPQLPPIPQQPNHVVYQMILWLVWCLFPPIGMCFLACKHFLVADTFMTKARFYRFFLHQTQSKRDGNVRKKAWRTLFIVSPVLVALARPLTQESGRRGSLAASYTWTSTDSNSSLLSSWIRISSNPNRLSLNSF